MESSVLAILLCLLLLVAGTNVDSKKARRFLSRSSSTRFNDAISPRSCPSSAVSADSCKWSSVRSSTKSTGLTKRHIAPRPPPRFPLTYDGLFRRRRRASLSDAQATHLSYAARVTPESRISNMNVGTNFVHHDADSASKFNHIIDKKYILDPKTNQLRKNIYSYEDRLSEFQNSLGFHHRNAGSRYSSKNRAIYKRNGSHSRHRRKTRSAPKINRNIQDDHKNHVSRSTSLSLNDPSSKIYQAHNDHCDKITHRFSSSNYCKGKDTHCSDDKNPDSPISYSCLATRGIVASDKPYSSVHIPPERRIHSGTSFPAIQFQASSVAFNSLATADVSAFHNAAHHAFHRSQNIHAVQGHGGPHVHDAHPVVKPPNVHVGEFNKFHEIHRGHHQQSTKAHFSNKRHTVPRTLMNDMVKKTRNERTGHDNPEKAPRAIKVRRIRRRKKKRNSPGFQKVQRSLGRRPGGEGRLDLRASKALEALPLSILANVAHKRASDPHITSI